MVVPFTMNAEAEAEHTETPLLKIDFLLKKNMSLGLNDDRSQFWRLRNTAYHSSKNCARFLTRGKQKIPHVSTWRGASLLIFRVFLCRDEQFRDLPYIDESCFTRATRMTASISRYSTRSPEASFHFKAAILELEAQNGWSSADRHFLECDSDVCGCTARQCCV